MKINHISTHWAEHDRAAFVTEDFNGIVEIEFPRDYPEVGYIWNLWVNEPYRRKGYAKALMNAAEEYIARQGRKTAALFWGRIDTPQWVLDWYMRNGYEDMSFGEGGVDLEKELKPTKSTEQ